MVQATRKCSIDGCEKASHRRRMCDRHYRKYLKDKAAPCTAQGCQIGQKAKGYCAYHHELWLNENKPECSVPDCSKQSSARKMCAMHYRKWRIYGDPSSGNTFYATSAESFDARTQWQGNCLIWTGSKTGGYGRISFEGSMISAHRYIWMQTYGKIPEEKLIDHICHNRACVNVKHLRIATHTQNLYNRSGPNSNSRSGARNVISVGDRWMVRIHKGGSAHYFGTYDTVEEAAIVAGEARKEIFGQHAGKG